MKPSSPDLPSATPGSRIPGERDEEKRLWGLLQRRNWLVPSFRGWIVLALGFVLFLVVATRLLHPFLALNDPISDGLLVVEGWTPDYGLETVVSEFRHDHYQKIYVTGGPLEYGSYLVSYKTYAQLAAASLIKLGLDSDAVQPVPAPRVRQDRTYTSAVSLKKWLLEHGIQPTRIHLMTDGTHARRSRLLFQKAMGDNVVIGVTSIPVKDYDPEHWWRYSAGVRGVINEALAYLYARFLFYPPKT